MLLKGPLQHVARVKEGGDEVRRGERVDVLAALGEASLFAWERENQEVDVKAR